MSYRLCTRACGTGPEAFNWTAFYQQFSSWLLPYLALLSQLPFGAESRLSNLTSVFLTVGSPVLAAYSLALTVLNGRWVTRRFRSLTHPNVDHAAGVLRNLQAAPIRLSYEDRLLPSLVLLKENEEWWKELSDGLVHTSTWSVAAVASMVWVVVAYVLTIIDSFTNIPFSDSSSSSPAFRILDILDLFGKGIGFLWLWLVPVVYGWIQISPLCDAGRLRRLFKRVDADHGHALRVDVVAAVVRVGAMSGRGLTIRFHPEHATLSDARQPTESALEDAELCAPIFNYARLFSWSAAAEEVASAFQQAAQIRLAANPPGDHDIDNVQHHAWDQYTSQLSQSSRLRARWAAYERMILASIGALSLQWGTTGAAILVVYFVPTVVSNVL